MGHIVVYVLFISVNDVYVKTQKLGYCAAGQGWRYMRAFVVPHRVIVLSQPLFYHRIL